MFGSLIVLILLPFINTSEVRSTAFRPVFQKFFWLFFINGLILGWIGQNVVESPYVEIGQICTVFYFSFLLIIIPFLGRLENKMIRLLLFYRRCSLMVRTHES